jgi:hypothetical protein
MRMRGTILAALALAVTATVTGPAVARRDKRPLDAACDPLTQSMRRNTSAAGLLIAGFDTGGDAKTDRAELRAGTEHMFAIADRDRSGDLSLIELSEWATVWLGGPSAVPGRFDFDRDQDDRVSSAEFAAELQRRFTAFDADKDGVVNRAELLAGRVPQNCVDGRLEPPQGQQRAPDQR